ncbi:MAG: putative RNA pseudouridine synthase [Thermodesulfobacteriota bacterium]|nr:MAG: putative RNA pseudouridine synthase [Thermodesulfobacteriota bacterium]
MKIRLNRYLSICGISSRRGADNLISDGVVSVNGKNERNLGSTIDPDNDVIKVRGKIIKPEQNRYLILNKPKLYITALGEGQDEKRTIQELITEIPERVYPVGRLDYDVEGVILLTNDGELANRVLHPSFELKKTYFAIVKGNVSNAKSAQMAQGVELEDGYAKPDSIKLIKADKISSTLEISFHEGRNHLVKRFFAEFMHPVRQLRRMSVGPLSIGNLERGRWRDITSKELKNLKKAVGLEN